MELAFDLSQKQVISNRTLQSLDILSMSCLELATYINELALENPMIEIDGKKENDELTYKIKRLEWLMKTDEQNRELYRIEKDEDENNLFFSVSDKHRSLPEYIKAQIRELKLNQNDRNCCFYLADCLDQDGFLTDYNEIRCFSEYQKEKCLRIIQRLEPAGVGAKSLSESLLIQLKMRGIFSDLAEKLIINDLRSVSRKQHNALAKKYCVMESEIINAYKLIKSLDPKPGSRFHFPENSIYIYPDVNIIRKVNGFEVLVSDSMFSEFYPSRVYLKMLKETNDDNLRKYLEKKLTQLNWVNDCISKRNQTLMRTTEFIVNTQINFFKTGSELIPLKLRDISGELGLHISTISRTIKNKYVECDLGLFPLDHFLTGSANSQTNTSTSTVQALIREIIDGEDKRSPFSDQKISDLLYSLGIETKRRTVAKYRDLMMIPSASCRRALI